LSLRARGVPLSAASVQPVFHISRQQSDLASEVAACLDAINGPARSDSVFVKPNFTYPYEKPGVTTTRRFLVALVEALLDRGVKRICLGEGEGGYNAFSMDRTFASYRVPEMVTRYGISYANVNEWPSHTLHVEHRRRSYAVRFPAPILSEFDSFISAPVPKVHCMTTISGAIKNVWGLIQDPMRLRLHCAFEPIVATIVESIGRGFAMSDGTFGLTKNGPMVDGETLELGWIAGSDNLWLHDLMTCRLMRIEISRVAHLQYGVQRGLAPEPDRCDLRGGWEEFVDSRFYLKRNGWNRLAKIAWHSPSVNHLMYTSRVSSALHKAMYSVRNKSPDLLARGVDWE
ncbi:MAG: DUF362 domain-containing protein, partial [Actinobacteria bacterium]|nr:DUF362 domain-containing protein [Actinomycetota bacterium]